MRKSNNNKNLKAVASFKYVTLIRITIIQLDIRNYFSGTIIN